MGEENKNIEEVKEINPIDEYLNNYKEQKLAEFCVQKDKHIDSLKAENHKFAEQLVELKEKVEKYDKCFDNIDNLYKKIKEMSIDNYLNLYDKFVNDISRRDKVIGTKITAPYNCTTIGSVYS